MRASARWGLVLAAVVAMLAALGTGPRATETARATQPDVYQATAGSSAVNVMGFQTGSAVDPAPVVNTAFPLTGITADNGPSTLAHAAYVEPPAVAQAATGLNNVPVPYATQADAQCNVCSAPRTADADGTADQSLDGGRVELSGGKAHSQANLYAALATASDGEQRVAPFDQVATLFDALVNDVYSQAINKPGNAPPPSQLAAPPCATSPATAPGPLAGPLSTFSTVCANDLPLHSLLVSASASDSTSQVTTDSNGTVVDATSQVNGTRLLDGLITVGSIHTAAHAVGDGTAAGTHVTTGNDIEQVCVAGDCGDYSITAAGICTQAESHSAPLCENDQLNQQLRTHGFNVCRLGSATSQSDTTATASVSGLLVEFHAVGDNGGYTPDAGYFTNGSLCEAAPPAPRAGWSGISFYAIVGTSSLQLHTDLFPSAAASVQDITGPAMPNLPDQGGSSTTTTTTIVNNVTSGGVYPKAVKPPIPTPPSYAVVYGKGNDRRPLLLTVFGLLELILLSNLTAMARARRRLGA